MCGIAVVPRKKSVENEPVIVADARHHLQRQTQNVSVISKLVFGWTQMKLPSNLYHNGKILGEMDYWVIASHHLNGCDYWLMFYILWLFS